MASPNESRNVNFQVSLYERQAVIYNYDTDFLMFDEGLPGLDSQEHLCRDRNMDLGRFGEMLKPGQL